MKEKTNQDKRIARDDSQGGIANGLKRKEMKISRIVILIMMGFIVSVMGACPKLYDSKQMARAFQDFHESPGDATRNEIKQARVSDSHHIWGIEFACFAVITSLGFLLYRIGSKSD